MGVTEEAVLKHLHNVRNLSQESIETISLWIMHHKDLQSIRTIVRVWLTSFKTAASDEQRIGLFYIMNDVVQRAKNKHIDAVIPTFQPAVLSAVSTGRAFDKVKQVMGRCIEIFRQREVFTAASVSTMRNLLRGDETDGDDGCFEVYTADIAKKIEGFKKGCDATARAFEAIETADFSFKDQIQERMRNRREAEVLISENKKSIACVLALRHAMEKHKKRMLELVETLELAKRVYNHQLREVTVVEDAYQKFWQGIREVHNELNEISKTGAFPGATPPRDAPSPTANDDIYATGVENVLDNLRNPGVRDDLTSADMDIGNEDDDGNDMLASGSNCSELPPPPLPPSTLTIDTPTTVVQKAESVPVGDPVEGAPKVSPVVAQGPLHVWARPPSVPNGFPTVPPPIAFVQGAPPPVVPPPFEFMQGVPPPKHVDFCAKMMNSPAMEMRRRLGLDCSVLVRPDDHLRTRYYQEDDPYSPRYDPGAKERRWHEEDLERRGLLKKFERSRTPEPEDIKTNLPLPSTESLKRAHADIPSTSFEQKRLKTRGFENTHPAPGGSHDIPTLTQWKNSATPTSLQNAPHFSTPSNNASRDSAPSSGISLTIVDDPPTQHYTQRHPQHNNSFNQNHIGKGRFGQSNWRGGTNGRRSSSVAPRTPRGSRGSGRGRPDWSGGRTRSEFNRDRPRGYGRGGGINNYRRCDDRE